MEETNKEDTAMTDSIGLAWSAFYDDKGEIFYYNSTTEESAWDPPKEGFNPVEGEPPAVSAEAAEAIENDTTTESPHDDASKQVHDWSAHYDDEGDLYYFNSVTQESAWEAPLEPFNPPEQAAPVADAVGDDDFDKTNGKAMDATTPVANVQRPESEKGPQQIPVEMAEIGDAETPVVSGDAGDATDPHAMDPSNDGADSASEPADVATTTPDTALAGETKETTVYDWSAHFDEEGRMYYFNSVTEESAWEAPSEGFNPPEDESAPVTTGTTDMDASTTDKKWAMYKDDEGRDYYYNLVSGESLWDQPDDFDGDPGTPTDVGAIESETKSPAATNELEQQHDDTGEVEPEPEVNVEEPEPEVEIDPALKRLQDAESALNSSDSVLEPSCMSNVAVVVAENSGNPAKAIAALIENYHGQTAVCGLLSRWLVDLNEKRQAATTKDAATKLVSLNSNADKIREVVQQVIKKMAKERFTKDAGDGILDLSKSEAAFLEEMMDSSRWRTLLIDLSAAHKDSAVLMYCLRAISKRGHHREIARRINQSDHFAVYNAMLLSELSVIGCQAISAGSDVSSATGLDELIQDLTRACSSTSYTYLYAVELLRHLEHMARREMAQMDASNGSVHERFRRAVRKWEGMIQTLEGSMVDPSAPQSVAGSSPLLRKRRLDIALMISELNQGQMRRKRLRLTGHSSSSNRYDSGQIDSLETGLLSLLKRHSIGIQLEDAVLDKLLPSGLDMDTRGIGDLLLLHPLAIRALLGHLFKPGQTRVISPSTKNKCGRLIALAMIAAESAANEEIGGASVVSDAAPDDLAISRMIVQGSQLCEQVETMISFLVTKESNEPESASTSVGQKLCSLALKCAPVGLGVVMWAREFTRGREYAASASFPTISPSILSLVRLVAMKHPFARSDALKIALAFLRHSNTEISYQKVNSIKETSLRLLLHLLAKGDVVPVLSSLLIRVRQVDSSEIDASLIRYFVGGVLEIAHPPVTPVFVVMFGRFLNSPKVLDAVRSNYFSDSNRKLLGELLLSFNEVRLVPTINWSKEDSTMVSALLSSYQVECREG